MCSCQEWDSHSRAKVTHPGLEVHRRSSVEQQRCHVDVPVVSGDVQRRETALETREKEKESVNEEKRDKGRQEAEQRKPNMRGNLTLVTKEVQGLFTHKKSL